jgi:two-component system sensor histidine kinase KdpD
MLSLRVGPGPVLFAGAAGALTWNYLFIPPKFTLAIDRFEDGLMFASYFIVSVVSGLFTARAREQANSERAREERATALLRLAQAVSAARTLDDMVAAALRQVEALFGSKAAVLLSGPGGLAEHPTGTYVLTAEDRRSAAEALRCQAPAGAEEGLPSSPALHLPLLGGETAIGILVIGPPAGGPLSVQQLGLAESIAGELAQLVEREHLRAAGERAKLLAESDKLHRTLLDGVSHELKTPLAVLSSAAENLANADGPTRSDLVQEIQTATRRLNRLVNNLLDQTRLESGALRPRLDWCDAHDLVNAAIDGVSEALDSHPFELDVPGGMPLFRADSALMEQVIANLLLNAALHTPPGTEIFLTAGVETSKPRIYFTVADRGPGLPSAMRERLFQKFQRGDAARAGGLGLGLSIIRGFVTAQGGDVVAGENPGGGAVLTVYLPFTEHGVVPPEQE